MNPNLKLSIFSIISFIFLFFALFISKKIIKKDKTKNVVLLLSSILTIFIHYSVLLYEIITKQEIIIENNMYLPIYPCNAIMWLCLIVSILNKNTKIFSYLAEFVFIVGTICGFIGLCFNYNFLDNPNFLDYKVLKGLISHVTMLYTTLYLAVMGYIKIHTLHNLLSCFVGAIIFIICGLVSILVNKLLNNEFINAYFLLIDNNHPFMNFYVFSFLGVIVLISLLTLYEIIFYEKKDRWYNNLRKENLK